MSLRWLIVSLVLVGVLFTGAAAHSEQVLVYAAFDEPTLRAIAEAFTAETGIDVQWVRGGGGEMATRIRAEAPNPKADVYLGGSVDLHGVLAEEGLLVPLDPPNAEAIPAQFKDPEGRWFGWYTGVWGYVINTELLAESGLATPKTWEDILDPKWQGHVMSGHPATCGGGYDFLRSQIFRFAHLAPLFGFREEEAMEVGEEVTWRWFEAFEKNVVAFNTACPETIVLVAQGQAIIGLSWANDILVWMDKGYPIDLVIPPYTAYAPGGISLIKGCKHPDAGAKFVNFVLSVESQEINAKVYRYPLNPEVPVPEGTPSWESLTIVPYDTHWAAVNKDRLLDEWERRIGR
jgi:iron(III) transport system substrate-binding protein